MLFERLTLAQVWIPEDAAALNRIRRGIDATEQIIVLRNFLDEGVHSHLIQVHVIDGATSEPLFGSKPFGQNSFLSEIAFDVSAVGKSIGFIMR